MKLLGWAMSLLVLCSGCVSVQSTSSSADPCTPANLQDGAPEGCTTNNLPPPPGKYEIVDIDESGDLNGVDKTWAFTTEPNATVFRVQVDLTGPAGGPAYTASDYAFELVGGPKQNLREGATGTGNSALVANSDCVICYDGARQENNYGDWTLRVKAAVGVGEWHVKVTTKYT